MRKPDAETYELGHWESMTIQRALSDYADLNATYLTEEQKAHVKELANIFAFGTHTVTRKAEE